MRSVVAWPVVVCLAASVVGCAADRGTDSIASRAGAGAPALPGSAGSVAAMPGPGQAGSVSIAGGGDQPVMAGGGTTSTPPGGGGAGTVPAGGGTPATFDGAPDPRDAVIYQVNLRAFSERGFQGVIERLDKIRALGINVIYLMPVTPVGQLKSANSPYCVRNYKEVNPEFGSLDDLKQLVDGAHQRGMAVILDWVANHTAWDNPWITDHPDWYEHDSNGNIQPGKVGDFVWNDVAKLNFDNQAMRLGMIDALQYWITTVGSDGFRFDYSDGPPIDFWLQANGALRANDSRRIILYAEGGRQDNYRAFDYNHGFSFYNAIKDIFGAPQSAATRVDDENNQQYSQAGANNRLVRYITNHDVNGWDGVPQNLFGGQAGAFAAFVIAAYNRGVPLVYDGQEIALSYPLLFPFTDQKIQWTDNPPVTDEYTKLIKFYAQSQAIRRGMPTSYSNYDVSAFTKESDGERAFVVVNVRSRGITYNLPGNLQNTTWYSGFDKSQVQLGGSIELAPYQYLALTSAPLP